MKIILDDRRPLVKENPPIPNWKFSDKRRPVPVDRKVKHSNFPSIKKPALGKLCISMVKIKAGLRPTSKGAWSFSPCFSKEKRIWLRQITCIFVDR